MCAVRCEEGKRNGGGWGRGGASRAREEGQGVSVELRAVIKVQVAVHSPVVGRRGGAAAESGWGRSKRRGRAEERMPEERG